EHQVILEKVETNNRAVERYLRQMEALASTPALQRFISDFRAGMQDYHRMQDNYIALIGQGRIDEARRAILGPMLAPFDRLVGLLTDLQAEIVAEADQLKTEQLSAIATQRLLLAAFGLLLLLFSLLMGALIMGKINRPLRRLSGPMHRVELGGLARDFHAMQQGIAGLVSEVQGRLRELETAAEVVLDLSREGSRLLDAQQQDIGLIASAMNQMEATFQEMARTTTHAAEVASRASAEARSSDQVVGAAIEQLNQAAAEIHEAGGLASDLQDDSKAIGAISDVISEIAEQTNLLA